MIRQIYYDSIFRRDQLLVDPDLAEYAAWDVVLTTQENNSGEMQLTIPPSHPAYDLLSAMTTEIYYADDGEEQWRGRLIAAEADELTGNKKLTVKGIADYLHDTIVQLGTVSGAQTEALTALLTAHNTACGGEIGKRFSVGTVTVSATVEYKGDQWQHPWDILSAWTKTYGGRIVGRRDPSSGVRYIDWLTTETADLPVCQQALEEGVNLLKLTDKVDGSGLVTRLYGYGKEINGTALTVETVNNGLAYIEDAHAVAAFGVITGILTKSDAEDPAQLLAAMQTELQKKVESARELSANAVDLHDLGQAAQPFEVGYKVPVVARRLPDNEMLRVTKVQRQLFKPKNTKITLGASARLASEMIRRSP